MGRQRLQRGALAHRAGLRRPRPGRARLHAELLDAPHHQRDARHHMGRRAPICRNRSRCLRPDRRVGRAAGPGARPVDRVPLLAQQPDRHGAAVRGHRCRARGGPERCRRRRRGVRRVRPTGHAVSTDAARRAPQARRDAHHEQGVRLRRRSPRLPRGGPRARRRAAPRPAALPPEQPDADDRPHRPRARRRHARHGRGHQAPARPDRRPSRRARCAPRRQRQQLRPLRRPPRREGHVGGPARRGRPRPRHGHRPPPARHGGRPPRDDRVPRGHDAPRPRPRPPQQRRPAGAPA